MLQVDLAALAEGPVAVSGTVNPKDPGLTDLEFALREPVRVSGRIMESGPGGYYWVGRLQTVADQVCRRCLAPVAVTIDQAVEVLFTDDETADDPSAYVISRDTMVLELDEAIREELILAAPRYPECREDCKGICPNCGKDLNLGPCGCSPKPDPRWAGLEALKTRPDDTLR
jgi:uncharacterized protein